MIKTYNLVPEVYYKRSRDFQFLGRLYDVIFNYIKMNSNIVGTIPYGSDIDNELVPLVCTTLGFKQIHEYNTKQLKELCSIFSLCLRNKGNLKSIQDLLNLLLNVEDESEEAHVEVDLHNPYLLNIFLPTSVTDTSLFEDMLLYLLPAGMSYRIVKEVRIKNQATDKVYFESELIGKQSVVAVKAQAGKALYVSQLHDSQDGTHSEETLQTSAKAERGRMEDMLLPKLTENDQTDMNDPIKPVEQEEE